MQAPRFKLQVDLSGSVWKLIGITKLGPEWNQWCLHSCRCLMNLFGKNEKAISSAYSDNQLLHMHVWNSPGREALKDSGNLPTFPTLCMCKTQLWWSKIRGHLINDLWPCYGCLPSFFLLRVTQLFNNTDKDFADPLLFPQMLQFLYGIQICSLVIWFF